MKIKYFQGITIAILVFLLVTGLFFGDVLESRAQSSQIWSEPINLSNAGSSTNPAMVIDAAGMIHVVWFDQFDGYKYTNSTDGVNWTTPDAVRFPFSPGSLVSSENSSPPEAPVLLADKNGGIHAFWREKTNALYYSKVSPSPDLTTNWTNRLKLADSVVDFNPVISSQSIVHLGYVSSLGTDDNPSGVYYRRLTGSGWSIPINLYSSQYYRSSNPEDANLSLAIYEANELETVYMVWDDRPQKRILLSKSVDTGSNWGEVREVIIPESNSGFSVPFNVKINTLDEALLMMWQVGDPGIRCTQYSKWSSDGGESWDEPIRMFDEFAVCPEKSEFISLDPNYSVASLSTQSDLSLIAWNGIEWSEPEIQSGLSAISNPRTFDPITFGCQQISSANATLYVVGCDQGAGGDIWFVTRQLDPLDNLFPQSSAWSGDANVTTVPGAITSLSSAVDAANNVHALWIESSTSPSDAAQPRIAYARRNGTEWTNPVPVITDLNGLPLNLSLQIDGNQRLLLAWANQQTGELLFAWANSERANIPVEWTPPIVLSASSKLTNSPDILVDSSNRIVVAYAITLNEERGIYVIQSTDLGDTWSTPVRVFDAVLENWEMVDQPKLALSEDGKLHALFTRYALFGDPVPIGLYYSQSEDGGVTWTPPEIISEQHVQWSEIGAYQQTLHRLWQEKTGSVALTNHQTSQDGGITWSSAVKIPGDAVIDSQPSVSVDWIGIIHFLQVIEQNNQVLQEWEWSEERWTLSETRRVSAPKLNSPAIVEGGITLDGNIYALLQFEKLLDDEIETSVLNISRSLEITEPAQPFLASISTPSTLSLPTAAPDLQPTPNPTSPLANLEDVQTSPLNKNMVGLFLIISVVFLILVFTVPRKKK